MGYAEQKSAFQNRQVVTFKSKEKTLNGVTYKIICQLRQRGHNDRQGYFVQKRQYISVTACGKDKTIYVTPSWKKRTYEISSKAKFADTGFTNVGWTDEGRKVSYTSSSKAYYKNKGKKTKAESLYVNGSFLLPSESSESGGSSSGPSSGDFGSVYVSDGSKFSKSLSISVSDGSKWVKPLAIYVSDGSQWRSVK